MPGAVGRLCETFVNYFNIEAHTTASRSGYKCNELARRGRWYSLPLLHTLAGVRDRGQNQTNNETDTLIQMKWKPSVFLETSQTAVAQQHEKRRKQCSTSL